ncbi:MAG TPA: hypothetical protein VK163_15685 [Opitutaceae bacterium]|nr:hypothetical protein [Opitutaceae bacterium]
MNMYPAVDPIPLPAPVWLFKGLHLLTTSLHFIAVEILIGGLLVAVLLNLFAALRRGTPAAGLQAGAAAALARRLPVVMTYVINLGVPPLLFAQVLYGRSLYTSSVLIGGWWIAVIPLLILAYWLLYQFADRAETGRSAWWLGALAWLVAGGIAKIYSTNMALMVRPEVWREMYSATATGSQLPPADPTLLPRWFFMMAGGLWVSGIWMLWIAGRKPVEQALGNYLASLGGRLAVLGVAAQAAAFWWLVQSLAPDVQAGLGSHSLYSISRLLWIAGAVLVLAVGAWAMLSKPRSALVGYVGALLSLVTIAGWTIVRDGIRDLTLGAKSYDVWDRAVVTNWGVVIIFFVVFVAGLGAAGWLISVVARAKPQAEGSLS